MRKNLKRLISLVFCILIATAGLTCYWSGTAAASDGKRTVKVAFFPMQGYHDIDENGKVTGMDVEYLEEVCKYTNWELEYVQCGSWDDALNKLENREVDLVGSAQYTGKRAAKYRYASLPSGYTYGMLAVRGDSQLAYEDFEQMKKLTYGMVESYVRKPEFQQYMKVHGIKDYTLKTYENTAALANALETGEIDVFVHSFMEIRDGWRVMGRFAPMPFYYITYQGNDELLVELNQAISDIKMKTPELENELLVKYYESRMDQNQLLTSAEKEYIQTADTLVVGYLENQYPFSYESGGDFCGISRLVMDEIAERTQLSFSYKKLTDFTAAHEALTAGEIDICCYSGEKEADYEEEDLTLTKSYAVMPRVLVMKEDQMSKPIKLVAMTSHSDDEQSSYGNSEDVSVVYYSSYVSCLKAVSEGRVDAAVCDSYLAAYLLSTNAQFSHLKVQNALSGDHKIYMAVRAKGDSPLVSIFNKQLPTITDKDVNDYMLQDDFYSSMSLQRFIEQNSIAIIGILLVFALLIVLILAYLLYNSNHIRKLTYKDSELNVWNESYFVYRANQQISRKESQTAKRMYAVAYTNINQFNRYNTLYGWNKGQRLLEICVEILSNVLNDQELYARSHGDHFIIFSEYTNRDKLEAHMQNIADLISERIHVETGIHMAVTIGLCYIIPGTPDIQVPLSYAIQAATNLQDMHKNTIQVYDEKLLQNLKDRHEREKLLESVEITEDCFTTFYQAKVDIRTEQVVGAEALIRFKDPTADGMIRSPYFFVPYYEEVGRITEIDFFVLECVCRMQHERLETGKKVVPISCNFSRLHFASNGFPDKFIRILDKYAVPKDLIEVEITETLVVDEMQAQNAKMTIDELHRRGIRLSIDDFGSGYSSLGVFESIPASVIKLDRSFLLNNENRSRQVKIMSNIVRLARDLDAQIVCEGVESEKDIALMQEIGANIAQGYRYSKPVSRWEFEQRLDT
ncbi:MAG: EAL domain-containing protein [bacterium]|nr:EAL domain-containing protein [bacterium]MDY4100590.1 EAL domain-containing protein [Lachnospiraceae bacterium]